jgi:23S rRNA pseudouridine1911/1915/1917 synthase
MVQAPFPVLYEDNHLLVVCKPAMLPTMGVEEGRASLLTVAKDYIREKYHKPGNVYLGVVSRLDAPVTGAVVIARTSKAAARLTEQFRHSEVSKVYWALVEGTPEPSAEVCVDWLRKDERHRRMHIAHENVSDAKEARLRYRALHEYPSRTLLEVHLLTGRKHQIRVQLAHRGHPVVGDRKYGARTAFVSGIALHSRCVEFVHPVRKTPLKLVAPLPPAWQRYGVSEDEHV